MAKNNSIYEVTRDDYKSFVEQIKPECREVKTMSLPHKTITRIFSKASGICLCSRASYHDDKRREKYYIFNMPAPEERNAPVPHVKLELKTKEEVQAVFDAFSKMRKEREAQDDGTV